MDYEKKYKEALERAKQHENAFVRDVIGEIFSELKESDDEKIKQELIEYHKAQAFLNGKPNNKHVKFVAWLEKQDLKFKVGDLIINKDGNGKVKQILEATNSGYTTNDGFATREIYEKNYRTCEIKDICQWKPSDEQLKALQGVYDWYMSHYPQNKEFESLFDDLLKL